MIQQPRPTPRPNPRHCSIIPPTQSPSPHTRSSVPPAPTHTNQHSSSSSRHSLPSPLPSHSAPLSPSLLFLLPFQKDVGLAVVSFFCPPPPSLLAYVLNRLSSPPPPCRFSLRHPGRLNSCPSPPSTQAHNRTQIYAGSFLDPPFHTSAGTQTHNSSYQSKKSSLFLFFITPCPTPQGR